MEIDLIVSSKSCGFPSLGACDQLVKERLRAMPDQMYPVKGILAKF